MTPGPDLDFWPLIPNPQLAPCPADIPRPFLFAFFLDPGCGPRLSSLNLTFGDAVPETTAAAEEEAALITTVSGRCRPCRKLFRDGNRDSAGLAPMNLGFPLKVEGGIRAGLVEKDKERDGREAID